MVASPYAATLPFDFRLSLGELPPMNDQAMYLPAASKTPVAIFDREDDELLAYRRQDEQRLWRALGPWDL